jgi:hypothetical protein
LKYIAPFGLVFTALEDLVGHLGLLARAAAALVECFFCGEGGGWRTDFDAYGHLVNTWTTVSAIAMVHITMEVHKMHDSN